MFRAYLDESGIHDDAPVCLVCGYFGHEFAWRKFNKNWERILAHEKLEEFHAWKYWSRDSKGERVNEYRGWSDERAERFLDDLLDVITKAKIHPVGAVVVMEHWHPLDADEREYLTGGLYKGGKFRPRGAPKKPYYLPFQSCILNAARYTSLGKKMHFRFDWNKHLKGHAQELYKKFKTIDNLSVRGSLGKISFPRGEDAPGLQAADLFAYQTYKFAPSRIKNPKAQPNKILMRTLSRARSWHDFVFFDEKGIELSLEAFREGKKIERDVAERRAE